MAKHSSEVKRMLDQISREYIASRQVLYSLSSGVSQRKFITSKLEHMKQLFDNLHEKLGENAMTILAEHLDNEENKAMPRSLAVIGSNHGIGPHNIAKVCKLPYERIISAWRNQPLFLAEACQLIDAINTIAFTCYTLENLSWVSAHESPSKHLT